MAIRKRSGYNAANSSPAAHMLRPVPLRSRRGITVLGLVLLILAIVVAVVLFTRLYPI